MRCKDTVLLTGRQTPQHGGHCPQRPPLLQQCLFQLEGCTESPLGVAPGEQVPVLTYTKWRLPVGIGHRAAQSRQAPEWLLPLMERRMSEPPRAGPSGHCLAFFTMVPTAEITVVLEPLALVVTVTTAGRVAVVVRMVGWAIVVTGMAESHLLFLFWASGVRQERSQINSNHKAAALPSRLAVRAQGADTAGPLASESQGAASGPGPHPRLQSGLSTNHSEARPCSPEQGREALAPSVE